MSKKDTSFTWHYDQKDTFNPPSSDQPVTVYADPGPTEPPPDDMVTYFGKVEEAAGLAMNARNYTLVLRPPAADREILTRWFGQAESTLISIEGGTVFYDTSLNKNFDFAIATPAAITIGDKSSLKIGVAGGGDIFYKDDLVEGPGFTLKGDSSFEVEVNGGSANHASSFVLNDTSRITTSGNGVTFTRSTITLKNSANLTATGRGDALSVAFQGSASISLNDRATVDIYSDSLDFEQFTPKGSFFTLNFADTRLIFLPLTKGAEPFEFGKGKYPKAMFNFIKDSAPSNQSRIFIPGLNLQAAFLRQAMVKDQVLAINGTIVQDTNLIDQKTESINGHYGTWISLSKKP